MVAPHLVEEDLVGAAVDSFLPLSALVGIPVVLGRWSSSSLADLGIVLALLALVRWPESLDLWSPLLAPRPHFPIGIRTWG